MRRLTLGMAALAAVMIAMLWTALLYDARHSREIAMTQAGRDARNLVVAFREHIRRTVGAIDQLMVAIVADHAANPAEFRIPAWVEGSPLLKGMALQVSLIDKTGILRASNLPTSGHVDLSDRPHFRYHLDPAAPQPYISVPVIGRVSNKWSIQFTRRMTRDGSTFDGVVVVSVDPSYFSSFFDSVNLGRQGAAALIGTDGIIRARRPRATSDIGADVSGSRLFRELRASPSGSYVATSQIDGVERIVGYTSVPDYPLMVMVGFATDDTLAAVRAAEKTKLAAGGGATGVVLVLTWLVVREVKRRREAERKQREDSFRALFEGNPVPMWLVDAASMRFIAVNDAAVAQYGYSRDQFLQMTVLDIRPPEDRDAVRERFKSQQTYRGEDRTWRHIRADGSIVEVRIYRRVLRYGGREVSLVGIIDVTESRRMERERDRSRELLDRIVDVVPLTIYVKDARTMKYVWLNRAGEKLLGVTRAALIGKSPHDVFDKETADIVVEHDRRFLDSAADMTTAEHIIHTPKNGPRLVTTRRIPICDQGGSPKYLVGAVEDVTDLKAIEGQLRQSQKMEAIGNLSGGVAHDFNNLLTIIIGNLDLLQLDVAGNPAAEQRVEAVMKASERGADLTRQMLAFSRRQPLQRKPVAVNKVVEENIRLLHRTLGEDVTVDIRLDADVGTVITDPQQFGTALVNIAVNARDAMPSGGTLTVATRVTELDATYASTHPEVKPGRYACIEVSDTGVGMPPELARRIFEPFFTTKPSGKGTGLGLSMVYGFVKQSGGHVNVYSEVGHGTTFRLYFPRKETDAAAPATADRTAPARPASGETVLVVDDNAPVRSTVVLQLKQLGYRILEAENARSALAILDGPTPVDLLFTDIIMPGGMNGKELGTLARQKYPMLKVLFTSGFPGTSLTGTNLDEGDMLLSKPYRIADLARAVRGALDVRTGAAAH